MQAYSMKMEVHTSKKKHSASLKSHTSDLWFPTSDIWKTRGQNSKAGDRSEGVTKGIEESTSRYGENNSSGPVSDTQLQDRA
jgi:hypothetical protein